MSERCFVRLKWDPASSPAQVGRAVGGFLRYIQHRDVHPNRDKAPTATRVAGVLKYAAYRDGASTRAELFCPEGRAGSKERKAFAAFVMRTIEESKPQLFRARDGSFHDRRRSVLRFIISPERADGIDLERLLRQSVARLETDMGVDGLRWLAAIHRNTEHHHIHLVLAGLYRDPAGGYHRVDMSKPRLAAMKQALLSEIERQRAERRPSLVMQRPMTGAAGTHKAATAQQPLIVRGLSRLRPVAQVARMALPTRSRNRPGVAISSVLRIRAAARRYAWQLDKDAAIEAQRRGWERAA